MNEEVQDDKNYDDDDFKNWKKRWNERLKTNNKKDYLDLMRSTNPLIIPRNHKIEEVLKAAELDNFKPVNKMVEVLNKPYNRQDNIIDYQTVTDEDKKEYKTFCGT